FRNVDGNLAVTGLPLPTEEARHALTLTTTDVVVAQGKRLVFYARSEIGRTRGQEAPEIHASPLWVQGVSVREPARIVSALPSLIVAEHPKLGRLTLERPVTL